jgi:hypothetical protein
VTHDEVYHPFTLYRHCFERVDVSDQVYIGSNRYSGCPSSTIGMVVAGGAS